jgi:hypothetical protein
MRKLLPVVVSLSLPLAACSSRPQRAPQTAAPAETAAPSSQPSSQPTQKPSSQPTHRVSLFHRTTAADAGPSAPPDAAPSPLAVVQNPQTGVAECDDYIQKYFACVSSRFPRLQQEVMVKALATTVDAWRRAAATSAGRQSMAQACKTALAAARKAMKAYNCIW